MKIFIISRGFPTNEYKMNGIFEMDQAKALQKAGLDVVFLSVDLRSIRRKRKFGMDSFVKDGVKMYTFDIPLGNIPKGILYKIGIWATKKLYKIAVKNEGEPDFIHTFFTDQAYMVTKAFEDKDIPVIVTECNSHINKDNIDKKLEKAASFAYNKASKLISVSPDFNKKLKKRFGVDSSVVTVIPNLDIFQYSPNKDNRDSKFRFVSTGRVTVEKGMEDLIDAFIKEFKDDENVTLDIFGDGNHKEALETKVRNHGLNHRIKLRGMTDRKIIAKEYQHKDVFCLYSHSETFGLAYLEALASGLPVISSKCGGPEHLIKENNGILVELNDVDALGKAMVYMKENIEKYNKEEISREARLENSAESITNDLIEIYKEVI